MFVKNKNKYFKLFKKYNVVLIFIALLAVYIVLLYIEKPISFVDTSSKLSFSEEEIQAKTNAVDKININTAVASQLDNLPGIGQAKAEAIIEYRNKNGQFKDISEIVNVSGISQRMFMEFEDIITTS